MVWYGAIRLGVIWDLVINFEVHIYQANNIENWQH